MCEGAHMPWCTHGGQRTPPLLPRLKQDLLFTAASPMLGGLRAFRVSPALPHILPQEHKITDMCYHTQHYVKSENPKLGPPACVASASATKSPTPLPEKLLPDEYGSHPLRVIFAPLKTVVWLTADNHFGSSKHKYDEWGSIKGLSDTSTFVKAIQQAFARLVLTLG